MKKTWLWCLLGVLSLGSTSMSQAQQSGGEIEKAIAALESQWMQSQRTNNPDLVAPLLADKFVNTSTEQAASRARAPMSWESPSIRMSAGPIRG